MDVDIKIPLTQVVTIPGVSLWENEDGTHIKPKGGKLVNAENIDGLPESPAVLKGIGFSVAGALTVGYTNLFVISPFEMYIKKIMVAVDVAPIQDLIIDIKLNGTSIYDGEKPTLPIGDTFVVAELPDTTLISEYDKVALYVLQASGENLGVTIVCEQLPFIPM